MFKHSLPLGLCAALLALLTACAPLSSPSGEGSHTAVGTTDSPTATTEPVSDRQALIDELNARLLELKRQQYEDKAAYEAHVAALEAKIKALDIAGYFQKIIVTDELGGPPYRKPNEAAFRLMQQALDVPFEKMVYIGDNTKKDFIAPQKLGMQTIYFKNRDGLYTE